MQPPAAVESGGTTKLSRLKWSDCARQPAFSVVTTDNQVESEESKGSASATSQAFQVRRLKSLRFVDSPASTIKLTLTTSDAALSFDFFRHKTGPSFVGFFDTSSWADFILRICYSEPTVLQAVAALGAVHQRYELGITPEALRWCGIADSLYRQAIKGARVIASAEESDNVDGMVAKKKNPEVIMVLAKLFADFEAFQDNGDTAVKYMTEAFDGLLHREVEMASFEEHPAHVVLNEQTLQEFFFTIEQRLASLFGVTWEVQMHQVWCVSTDEPMPKAFAGVEEVRDFIFAEVHAIWALFVSTNFTRSRVQQRKIHRQHLARLMAWSSAFAAWGKESKKHSAAGFQFPSQAIQLLQWYRETAFLLLLLLQMRCKTSTTPNQVFNIDTTSLDLDDHMVISSSPSTNEATFLANSTHPAHCSCDASGSLETHLARLTLLLDWVIQDHTVSNHGTGGLLGEYAVSSVIGSGMSTGVGLCFVERAECRDAKIWRALKSVMLRRAYGVMGSVASRKGGVRGRTVAQRLLELEAGVDDQHKSLAGVVGDERLGVGWSFAKTDERTQLLKTKWVDVIYLMEARLVCLTYCRPFKESVRTGAGNFVGADSTDVFEHAARWQKRGYMWTREWYKIC